MPNFFSHFHAIHLYNMIVYVCMYVVYVCLWCGEFCILKHLLFTPLYTSLCLSLYFPPWRYLLINFPPSFFPPFSFFFFFFSFFSFFFFFFFLFVFFPFYSCVYGFVLISTTTNLLLRPPLDPTNMWISDVIQTYGQYILYTRFVNKRSNENDI